MSFVSLWWAWPGTKTATTVLQCGFYWPKLFNDAYEFSRACDAFQRIGNVSNGDEMPQKNFLEVGLLDVWIIDFMELFPSSNGIQYTLVVIDYVSKWMEEIATTTCDANSVKQLSCFLRFGVPRTVIGDNGTHLKERKLEAMLREYGVYHKLANTGKAPEVLIF